MFGVSCLSSSSGQHGAYSLLQDALSHIWLHSGKTQVWNSGGIRPKARDVNEPPSRGVAGFSEHRWHPSAHLERTTAEHQVLLDRIPCPSNLIRVVTLIKSTVLRRATIPVVGVSVPFSRSHHSSRVTATLLLVLADVGCRVPREPARGPVGPIVHMVQRSCSRVEREFSRLCGVPFDRRRESPVPPPSSRPSLARRFCRWPLLRNVFGHHRVTTNVVGDLDLGVMNEGSHCRRVTSPWRSTIGGGHHNRSALHCDGTLQQGAANVDGFVFSHPDEGRSELASRARRTPAVVVQ